MDVPEKVLCQAHGQARPIADFLHENGKLFYMYLCVIMLPMACDCFPNRIFKLLVGFFKWFMICASFINGK